ncbi:hypothetical protein L228DRAFT_265965 [Xylona heveae TC161]|uniref:Uncharacterized protein n=1 Tax=Xylona heveae (strain CBS 132557 / TC161) TaxID=1328760 RepID=A0A165IX47_XYLHT|nr:hypothetical protein L228DRAFT_265965 [Xylona heveae TC161]KZF25496.1 hypothetical protein L228DRAFT_265965 [Xylona heveae TC161]
MPSKAKVLSTKLIAIITKGKRTVKVGYVDKTEAWKRNYLSPDMQKMFKETAEQHLLTLRGDTDMIALRETPHTSKSDQRSHITAVELNIQGEVTETHHFPVE